MIVKLLLISVARNSLVLKRESVDISHLIISVLQIHACKFARKFARN